MHNSVVLRKLRAGEPVWCGKANFIDPNAVEIMGHLGVPCVWICMEHGPIGMETVHNMVRTAKMMGMDWMEGDEMAKYEAWKKRKK